MTEKVWDDEMERVLGKDYDGNAPLPFPLESMAASIYSDWGRSMAEARASALPPARGAYPMTTPAMGQETQWDRDVQFFFDSMMKQSGLKGQGARVFVFDYLNLAIELVDKAQVARDKRAEKEP